MSATRENNLIHGNQKTHLEVNLRLTGEAPLMMHAPSLLDPVHPLTKEMGKLAAKTSSKRTPADHERLYYVDWRAALYHDPALGPFVPALNIKKALREAAGRWKLGAAVKRGVTFPATKISLEYDGARDPDQLYEAGFRDLRPVKNGGFNAGRVMRCRPCFEEWAVQTLCFVDPHEIGLEDLATVVEAAQRYGIGDYRPEYGLFSAEMWMAGT